LNVSINVLEQECDLGQQIHPVFEAVSDQLKEHSSELAVHH